MRRAGYVLTMILIIPLVALWGAAVTFVLCINTGIDCLSDDKDWT